MYQVFVSCDMYGIREQCCGFCIAVAAGWLCCRKRGNAQAGKWIMYNLLPGIIILCRD